MAHDIRVIPARDFLRADVHGQVDLEASKALLRALAAAVVGCQERHILIDTRGVGVPTLNSSDLFELVQTLKQLGLGLLNRIAILRHLTDTFDRGRFFEMLATDRGMHVGTFDDFESAFNWLQAGGPTPLVEAVSSRK
jgi:hypothetical protein